MALRFAVALAGAMAAAAGGRRLVRGPVGVKSDAAQIFPPVTINASSVSQWRSSVNEWRAAVLANLRYNGSVYEIPGLEWTQTSYVQPQMHPYDRFLWDPVARNWTVGRYLDDLRLRYGGIDSVLVWPTYTNIGADERNQFAMIRAMPGGIAGVRALAEQFHAHGVKMLVPYHVWDVGTRREVCPSAQPGCNRTGELMDDWDAMAALLATTDVDGFNGDAEPVVTRPFFSAAMARHHPLAFEPESEAGNNPLTVIEWDTLSWGEHWTFATGPPVVDAKKFLTHGKHNAFITSRWTHNINTMVATAWFNGIGINSWENVWGTWAGKTPRAAQQIRVLAAMLRFAGGHEHGGVAQEDFTSNRSLLHSATWEPFAPLVTCENDTQAQVYASTWPQQGEVYISFVVVADRSAAVGKGTVNASFELDSRYLNGSGWHCFDAYYGVELTMPREGTMTVEIDASLGGSDPALERSIAGIGGLLFTRQTTDTDPDLRAYLQRMQTLTSRPFSSFTCEGGDHCSRGSAWPLYPNCSAEHCAGLTQQMVGIAPTLLHSSAPTTGMVFVPGGEYLFSSRGAEIEGAAGLGVDFQWPWTTQAGEFFPKPDPPKRLRLPPLFADKYPVTCDQYARFLAESNYTPTDTEHWLERWGPPGTRTPPSFMKKQPVTHVSLNDARAYCAYYNKRLPATWEWQWIGQGADMRLYTWGNEPPANHTCPPHSSGQGPNLTYAGPRDVDALPGDCGLHGVCNMIGNVWSYTSEFVDQHTRAVCIKGGSNFRPAGSVWYLPQIRRLDEHQKYLLFSDGYERASTIGFRCVADAKPQCGGLCGQLDLDLLAGDSHHSINLTKAGSIDWLAFIGNQTVRKALGAAEARHRLAGFDNATSDNTVVVSITQGSALNWSDGDVVKSMTGERSALISSSGFEFTALASQKPSVLTLLLGSLDAAVNVSASLSDGSAPLWKAPLFLGSTSLQTGLEPVTSALQFQFSSPNPGTKLVVSWHRSKMICDRCHIMARGFELGSPSPGCVCAASGDQTPAAKGVANLTAEAAQGGNWVTIQASPKTKNLPVILSKRQPAATTATALIPLRLAFVANGTVSSNSSSVFGGPYGLRVYGNGSPLGVTWTDGPSSCPRFSDGAGVGLSSGVFVSRVGEGFVLEVGASAETVRQLTLYGGVDGTTGRMEARLISTGSGNTIVPPPIVRKVVSTGGSIPFKFVLVYRGIGVLTVRYYCAPDDNEGDCNLTFQGASVRERDPGRSIFQGAALALAG